MVYRHTPVMLEEALRFLDCEPGKIIADCTLGGAGHSSAILERILPGGLLIGVDQDIAAVKNARRIFGEKGEHIRESVRLIHGNFAHLAEYLAETGLERLDGILADLGLSQYQLEASGRGFSFNRDEPPDMRMNPDGGDPSAGDIVNTAKEEELVRIFREFGEERFAGQVARNIVRQREQEPIRSSRRLSDIISEAIPRKSVSRIHPATRVFMALRIAANRELERLAAFMEQVTDLLNPGGRLCVISFHSLEDRIVKQRLKAWEKSCVCPPSFPICVCDRKPVMRILTHKALRASEAETAANPMSRSAKLRAAEKI